MRANSFLLSVCSPVLHKMLCGSFAESKAKRLDLKDVPRAVFGMALDFCCVKESVVAEMALKFLRPARLDDLLGVSLEVTEVRRASLRLVQRVTLDPGGALLTDATVRVAVMARESGRPAPLPQWLHRKLGDS